MYLVLTNNNVKSRFDCIAQYTIFRHCFKYLKLKSHNNQDNTVKSRFYDIDGQHQMQRKIETRYLVNFEIGRQTF